MPVLKLPAAALLLTLLAGTAAAQPARPNVIFIMTDDLGYGDLSSYGATDVATPNLDAMAADGVRFTDFYANGANCSPTRAGFLTGRYQQRFGIEDPITAEERANGIGLASDGNTLPQLLQNNGYATALIGKWHLGYEDAQTPNANGFDYFFGYKSGYVDYYQHTNGSGEPDLWENNELVARDGYLTDLITESSIDYIDEHAGSPFFLSVQFSAPHWPYQPPDSPSVAAENAAHLQPDDDNPGSRADYVAMVERADQGIGEIIAAVDAAGIADNTLIVFTNDNGGEWLSRGQPLFQRKSSVWEGGIRVPTIVRWPGTIPAGVTTNQVGITMDITATILAITGTEVPADLELDGMNLLPILTGEQPEVERTLFWRTRGTARAVRSGDWKLIVQYSGPVELNFVHNLQLDIGERNDLAWSDQGRAVARRLRPLLDAWEAEMDQEAADYPWISEE